jgi:acyl-CoA thioesterase I
MDRMKTFFAVFSVALLVNFFSTLPSRAETLTILALGDSLTAGYGLDAPQSFTVRLEVALKAKGHDVTIINAGVSGDTAAMGASRLDWSLTDDVDALIVELGANDALRGLPVPQAEAALTEIVTKLEAKKLPVLLAGMIAPPNLGPDYGKQFDTMYSKLGARESVIFYPFFLEGVAAVASLNQGDGIHPNATGVDVIVEKILPYVEKLIAAAKPS